MYDMNAFLSHAELTCIRSIKQATEPYQIPVAIERVSAGFPSPAQDYVECAIDMNEHLIKNKHATFIVRANSLSMRDVGIDIGDELIVDKSLNACNGDIVIAIVDNDFTVKTLRVDGFNIWLQAENPDFSDIRFQSGQTLVIWGVVTHIIKTTRPSKRCLA